MDKIYGENTRTAVELVSLFRAGRETSQNEALSMGGVWRGGGVGSSTYVSLKYFAAVKILVKEDIPDV